MTETEWLACSDPRPMLEFLRGKVRHHMLRLFACACCRRIWNLFQHKDSFNAIEVTERFVEKEATREELRTAEDEAVATGDGFSHDSMDKAMIAWAAAGPAQGSGYSAARQTVDEVALVFVEDDRTCEEEQVAQCVLLREVIGNPFRPATVDPAWLAWNGATAVRLAEAAYQERELPSGHLDGRRLALLADALEDAGCADAEILNHLRSPGPHVRGCWVVDLVPGKE